MDLFATYQITVPGVIDSSRADWAGEWVITIEAEGEECPITIITGEVDQAGLHGLLRRLYLLGLPLISVRWIEGGSASGETG